MLSRALSILIYHRVLPEADSLRADEFTAENFALHMRLLARWCTPLPLREAVGMLRNGGLPARAVCVTFDDGYADNVTVALPILRARGVPATFFVATGFLDGGRMWNDTVIEAVRATQRTVLDASSVGLGTLSLSGTAAKREAIGKLIAKLKYLPHAERQARVDALAASAASLLPDNLMMTRDQVRFAHREGIEIGAHTVSHPILAVVDTDEARREIAESRSVLEQITGAPVRSFAYPNGKPNADYVADHVAIVRELGFDLAVSTAAGAARADADVFQLPRLGPWDRSGVRFLARLVQNSYTRKAELAVA
ncbi:MAG: polysaccharide deacetylase family protein [Betaproteobacteria bacterium]